NPRAKILIAVGVVLLLGTAAALSFARARGSGVEVRTEVIRRRDLTEVVTASGNIRARRTVDMSSDVSARVRELLVDEGDDVVQGQVLLRLDPDQYQAALSRAQASLAQAEAQSAQQEANLIRAQRDLDRLLALRSRDSLLVSRQQVDDARTNVAVAEATREAALHGVEQARAAVAEAQDQLSKTIFRAPMDGKVTRLNVEEGETVIIGTMNNPGSLVLTISDLSVMEVVVHVDETDVSSISLGDSAAIRIDAFPDREFVGRVTKIGNSAINPPTQQTAGQETAIDFEVVLTLDASEVPLRPDLSATADIVVEQRKSALAVPIIAMTVRADTAAAWTEGPGVPVDAGERQAPRDVEGVFLVENGRARFTPVTIGIAGAEYFEVLAGLSEGDTVVAGPYQRIRQLRDGDPIRATADSIPAG
ncbi:MAG TPA: efflux RND transporter periplasmic adaptor subunit, partial [Longimicrobiales bacterium]|nr:efflux RND transporter periplasmic adaptor subunit [Longimicrobiales bacterium]